MAMRVRPYGASSTPQVIGGPVNSTFMNDRYQPAIVTDASGRHAICYEWVQIPSGGPGLLRTGKENLSLATATSAPVRSGETPPAAGANDLIDNAPCQGSSCDLTPDIGISGSISPSTAARRGRSRPAPVLRHKTAPPAWARSTPRLATSSTGCPKVGLQ